MLVGAVGGVCGALLVGLWLQGTPGSNGALDEVAELRHDLVALSARQLAVAHDVDVRITAVEERLAGTFEDTAARAAAAGLAGDLQLLREALQLELSAVQDELVRMADEIEDLAGSSAGVSATAPLSDDEEPRHVVLSTDPDEGVRFSALVRLGRRRTDRSLQASLARLDDPSERVVWAAIRNLGAFREPSTAPAVAAQLEHERSVVRMAAYDALRAMGAPNEPSFDPVAEPDVRVAAAAQLSAWAREFAGE